MTYGSVAPERLTRAATTARDAIRVLIVDDEPLVRETIESCLTPQGHEVTSASGAEHTRVAVSRMRFDLVLLDLRLKQDSGLELIPELLEGDPSLAIVLMTAFGSVESAVEAMRRGAFDYITKPISPSELELLVGRVAERRAVRQRLRILEESAREATWTPVLDSRHTGMTRAIVTAREVARTDATVLITGESGTGKGVLARAIHGWSRRASEPFAVVNCPSLSAELLRSELFGHVRGSFTGAIATKVGKIEFADGGSLFLDEIGRLALEIQPALLRFLQDLEYERVGDPEPRQADVRLIAATNADLAKDVKDGRFRDDLFYRINVIQLDLPPLRARPDDIPPLAESFREFFAARYGKPVESFTDDAMEILRALPWPGNVRELQNAVERAVILAHGPRIGATSLPRGGNGLTDRLGLADPRDLPTLEGMEERYIKHVLEVAESVEQAAEVLGVAPSTLWRRRRKYGI